MNISCTLRWGVALVGGFLYWVWLTLSGTTFQVQGVHQWMVLSRGRDCEEGRHVALINPFVKSAWNKLVLAWVLYKRIVIKLFLDYCQYSRVCNKCKRVMIKLLWTVLNVMFSYFQLKYG